MFHLQAFTEDIGKITYNKPSVRDFIKTFSRDEKDKDIVNITGSPLKSAIPATAPEEGTKRNVLRMVQQFEDHAILDDIDIHKMSLGDREVADIQDNKTDDDQPDLDTDESSGDKSKIKLDVSMSMEGFTEATDITTPVEMAQESAPSRGVDFDTSYQISDLPDWSKHDIRMSTPETHHKLKSETLFDITDLDDLTDIEENMQKDSVVSLTPYSDRTLVAEQPLNPEEDLSPRLVESKIKMREEKIEQKFERMSMSMSDTETNDEGEEFCRLSTSVLSKEDEEQAGSNFDKIIFDNYVEDKSEDWLTHESDPSPEKETGSGEIFGAPEKEPTNANKGKHL
jgi:hypothetical protein